MTTSVSIGKKPDPVTLDGVGARQSRPAAGRRAGRATVWQLRAAVKPGGCSGYSYEMFFDSEVLGDDVVREYGGVRVVVDEASAELLAGATLDFSDGLQGAGFHITNPNATRTCGCGALLSARADDARRPRRIDPVLSFSLNGNARRQSRTSAHVLDVLRRTARGFTSVKDGCSPQGQCGCCTVLVDGSARVSCVTPGASAGRRVVQ